jgi:FtsH-binding integral membrane protein
MTLQFSARDKIGVLAGVGWGVFLGYFFRSGDMTGPWLVVLFGPPLILLISPAHPILSWQVPIITATIFGTVAWRSPDETASDLLGAGLLTWLMCTLFSSPWALIFQRRIERLHEGEHQKGGRLVSYAGVVLMVFAACALTILGFIFIFYPAWSAESSGRSAPPYGFWAVTSGVGMSIISYRLGQRLGVGKPIREVLDLMLGVCSTVVIFALTISLYLSFHPSHTRYKLESSEIYSALAVLETIVALIWLARRGKLEKRYITGQNPSH